MILRGSTILLFVCSLLVIEATPTKKHSKFDFPSSLVGLNDTAEEWLAPYSKIYKLADFGRDRFDGDAPRHIREYLANATISDDPLVNQYSEAAGIPRLREAIAKLYSPLIGHELNPDENIVVTVGGTEALHVAIAGHTVPGDEWIVIEPAYFKYVPIIKMAWGVTRYSPLRVEKNNSRLINGDDWVLNKEQLESLFNEKTKGIIVNNPLNPVGKVYKREELEFIASLAKKYDTLVISDEAHEWITFKPHIRMASLPGMFDRTITIGTASKTFSLTGWRIGWAYGHSNILNHLKVATQMSVNCPPSPQQYAIAYAFEEEKRNFRSASSFFVTHAQTTMEERDLMSKMLLDAGIIPMEVDGGFCVLGDWSPLRRKLRGAQTAMDFIVWMIENVQVVGWPLTMFYADEHKYMAEDYIRFCFHKDIKTIEDGARRFKKLRNLL